MTYTAWQQETARYILKLRKIDNLIFSSANIKSASDTQTSRKPAENATKLATLPKNAQKAPHVANVVQKTTHERTAPRKFASTVVRWDIPPSNAQTTPLPYLISTHGTARDQPHPKQTDPIRPY